MNPLLGLLICIGMVLFFVLLALANIASVPLYFIFGDWCSPKLGEQGAEVPHEWFAWRPILTKKLHFFWFKKVKRVALYQNDNANWIYLDYETEKELGVSYI